MADGSSGGDLLRNIPPGWNYNPSAWSERIPIVVLAVIGFVVAGYMSLFQFKIIDSVWEPFFGEGTRRVLTSKISHMVPIPDAALGAFGYLVDAVTGAIGGRERWRTMPWMVIVFGLAVGPLGAVSIALVMSQPLVVGSWCTLCLASAVISLVMIGPALDEMLASLQYMKRERVHGRSLWRVFWGLDTPRGDAADSVPRGEDAAAGRPEGTFVPWGASFATLIGLWLMAAPAVLGYGGGENPGPAEMSDRIIGPLVVTFSFVALWEVTQSALRIDLLAGAWLIVAPWLLAFPESARWSSLIAGVLLVGLAFWSRPRTQSYAGGWASLWPPGRATGRQKALYGVEP